MRRLRFSVAVSLDGFIAGPNGEYDWIVPDPLIDFGAIFAEFDTLLMGRRTYEIARTRRISSSDQEWVVVSGTLNPQENPGITILSRRVLEAVARLKARLGKDIWLFGGGVLFRSLLDAGLVDTVELTVMPVLLGGGVKLLAEGRRQPLRFTASRSYPNGTLLVAYAVEP